MNRYSKLALGIAVGLGAAFIAAPRLRAEPSPAFEKERVKNVTGTVLDKTEKALGGAVVYLKNSKTLAVKSFISQDNGEFRFNALSPNVDYELYAEFNGARSSTKTISSFDSKTNVTVTLKVDVAR
jgi:hypothetical protein